MEAQIPLKMLVGRLAINVEEMIKTELFGVANVIEEAFAITVFLHGEINLSWTNMLIFQITGIMNIHILLLGTQKFHWKKLRRFALHVVASVIARCAYEGIIW